MNLDVVVTVPPGAVDNNRDAAPSATPAPRLAALEALLARGECSETRSVELAAWLFAAFGIDAPPPLPLAAYRALGEGLDPETSYWLCADPINLTPRRIDLLATPLPPAALASAHAYALAQALTETLRPLGHALLMSAGQRWYLRCARPQDLITTPLPAGPLKFDETCMPRGTDGPVWRRLLTELQMVLHEHPVNLEREASGQMPVNSLWFWGGGRRVDVCPIRHYAQVWSNHPLAVGLARAAGVTQRALPDSGWALAAHFAAPERGLLVLDWDGKEDAAAHLARLERDWFQPLQRALGQGCIDALQLTLLLSQRSLRCMLRKAHLRRWWRRPRPLDSHA